jgi:hypothetical protein
MRFRKWRSRHAPACHAKQREFGAPEATKPGAPTSLFPMQIADRI